MFIYRKIRERFFGGIGNKILFKSIFIILFVIKFIRGVSRKFLLTMMDLEIKFYLRVFLSFSV